MALLLTSLSDRKVCFGVCPPYPSDSNLLKVLSSTANTRYAQKDRDKGRSGDLLRIRSSPGTHRRGHVSRAAVTYASGSSAQVQRLPVERSSPRRPPHGGARARVALGVVGAPVAPRLSSRSSAQRGDQPRQRVRVLEQRFQTLAVALDPRIAPQRRACLRALAGRQLRSDASARPRLAAARSMRRAAPRAHGRRPAGEHKALAQRVRGQPVGPVQAVHADSPTAYSPATAERPSRSVTIPPIM